MNPHLQTALKLYESQNIDMQSLIGWHLLHGIVISTGKVFALCYHASSNDVGEAVAFEQADTLFVTICCGDMASVLKPLKDNYKYLSFRRDFKKSSRTRLLNMNKFYSKLQ